MDVLFPRVALLHPDCDPSRVPMGGGALLGKRCPPPGEGLDLADEHVDAELVAAIPEHLARRYHVLPIEQKDNVMVVAMADPDNELAIDDIRLITGYDIQPVRATLDSIRRAHQRLFEAEEIPALLVASLPCPMQTLVAQVRLTGPLAYIELEQTCINPTDEAVEAVYLYRVEPGSTVCACTVQTLGGQFHWEVRPLSGDGPSPVSRTRLQEQDRPDVFSLDIGMVQPREAVSVKLAVATRLEAVDGDVVFRVPLQPATSRVKVVVTIDTFGIPMVRMACSQPNQSRVTGDGAVVIETDEAAGLSDRDFVLRYRLAEKTPVALLLQDDLHAMLTVLPPSAEVAAAPRDVVLLLDCSVNSIDSARRGATRLLQTLGPLDRFRLLVADHNGTPYAHGRICSSTGVPNAISWLSQTEPGGTLSVSDALCNLLDMPTPTDRLTSVVLVTDRRLDNEAAVHTILNKSGTRLRIFTVGVGTAVNPSWLRRVARLGHGVCTLIGPEESLEACMARLGTQTRHPVLTGMQLNAPLQDAAPLPDLYSSGPAITLGRKSSTAVRQLKGRQSDGSAWETPLSARSCGNPALGITWALDRVQDLEDMATLCPPEELPQYEAAIVELALKYRILTSLTTSFLVHATDPGQAGPAQPPGVPPTPTGRPIQGVEPECDLASRVVDLILFQAVRDSASQVHIEPTSGNSRVLYRTGGILRHLMSPPGHVHAHVISRLKAMAGLDQGKLPQEGHLYTTGDHGPVSVTVNSIRTLHGEAVVLTLAGASRPAAALEELDMPVDSARLIARTVHGRTGLTVVLGPRALGVRIGYGCTRRWDHEVARMVSLEEDPEQRVQGLSQVQFPPGGLLNHYLAQLEAQDPDLTLVTVPVSPSAAQRLARYSRNSRVVLVVDSVDPMLDLLRLVRESPALSGVLNVVVVGDGVQVLCSRCRVRQPLNPDRLVELDLPVSLQPYSASGCIDCDFAGSFLHREWRAWEVRPGTREDLARASTRADLRGLLMEDATLLARQRLERGEIDLDTYRLLRG